MNVSENIKPMYLYTYVYFLVCTQDFNKMLKSVPGVLIRVLPILAED